MDQARGKTLKLVFIAFLVGVTIFSLFKYISSLKERYDLLDALEKNKQKILSLETQRQNLVSDLDKERNKAQGLSQEKVELSEKLKLSEAKTTSLKKGMGLALVKIKQLNCRNSILEAENIASREEKDNLKSKLIQVDQENNSLKAKLSSIAELKKAIRDLKIQKRNNRATEGNRGFLVKDGQPTSVSTVKIEVSPVQEK